MPVSWIRKTLSGTRSSTRVAASRSTRPPHLEQLEDRLSPTVSWTGGGNGVSWSDPANWSTGSLPTASDDVVINLGGATIVHSSGTDTINSLTSSNAVTLSGGSLTVTDTVQVNNTFTLSGGTLRNATVLPGNGGQGITLFGSSTLDGVTLNGEIDLTHGTRSSFVIGNIVNGLTLNGTMTVGSPTDLFAPGFLYFNGSQTIGGSGTIVAGAAFGDNAGEKNNFTIMSSSTVTFGPNLTIRGKNARFEGVSGSSFVNQGTIAADVAGGTLSVAIASFPGTVTNLSWSNSGTLRATNGGTLTLGGSLTNSGAINASGGTIGLGATGAAWSNASAGSITVSAGSSVTFNGPWTNSGVITETGGNVTLGGTFSSSGTINHSGGTMSLPGTFTNTGGNLALDTSGGSLTLSGTILGGSVTTTNGAALILAGGTLNGVTLNGDIDLTRGNRGNPGGGTIVNGLTLNGTITVGSPTDLFAPGFLYFTGSQTIGGSGTIVAGAAFGDNAGENNNLTIMSSGTVTFGPNLTIRGKNARFEGVAGSFVNQGTIAADVAGGTFSVGMGSVPGTVTNLPWSNSGTLRATNGATLMLGGSLTNNGAINANGGSVYLGVTGAAWSNASAGSITVSASSTVGFNGPWTNSGVITETGGNVILGGTFSSSGTISHSGGTMSLPGTFNNTGGSLALDTSGGSLTLSGTILGGTVTTTNAAALIIAGGTLNGVTLNGAAVILAGATLNGVTVNGEIDMTQGNRNNPAGATIVNGLALNGTITLGSPTDEFAPGYLYFNGSQTIGGNATIVVGAAIGDNAGENNNFTIMSSSSTVTFGSNLTIRGKYAKFEGVSGSSFVNQGTIAADLAGGTFAVATGSFPGTSTSLPWSNSGTLRAINGGILMLGGSLTNNGPINANGGQVYFGVTGASWSNASAGSITVSTGSTVGFNASWTNSGTITETGGSVTLGGTFSSSGTINHSGGTMSLSGTFTNTGGNLALDTSAGSLILSGTILGGTVTTTNDAALILAGGTLNGVTMNGAIDLTHGTRSNPAGGTIVNGLTLNGTIALGSPTDEFAPGYLYFTGSQIIGGNGTIVVGAAIGENAGENNNFFVTSSSSTVTFGPNLTIRGKNAKFEGVSGSSFVNQGTISAEVAGGTFAIGTGSIPGSSTTLPWSNSGTLRAANGTLMLGGSLTNYGPINASGGSVYLGATGGSWSSQGTITASGSSTVHLFGTWTNRGPINLTDSTLILKGNFDTTGPIHRTGGDIVFSGTMDNRGKTLCLDETSGSWTINGGTILGGTVITSNGAFLDVRKIGPNPAIVTLDGVTLNGDMAMTHDERSGPARAIIVNGLTLNGTITLGSATDVLVPGNLYFDGSQTIGGNGTIVAGAAFGENAGENNNLTIMSPSAVTFGPNLTIRGKNARFEGVPGSSFVNQGTIAADGAGSVSIGIGSFPGTTTSLPWTNSGTLRAANGGSLLAQNSPSNYSGGILTGGDWHAVNGGTLQINGMNVTTNAANIVLDGPTAKFLANNTPVTSVLANLAQSTSAASLALLNGAAVSTSATLTNGGKLALNSGAVLSTAGDFINSSSSTLDVSVGAGALTPTVSATGSAFLSGALSVSLLDGYAPEANSTLQIVSANSVSGVFSSATGLFSGRQQLLSVFYGTNEIRLTAAINAADLAVSSVSIPASGTSGQNVTIDYQVQNTQPTATASNEWIDSIYLTAGTTLNASAKLIGRVTHTGVVAGNSSYSGSLTAPLPGTHPGDYRVIVVTDSRGLLPDVSRSNNTLASAGTIHTAVSVLTVGSPISGTIASGQDLYYQVTSATPVELDATFAVSAQATVLIRNGDVPDLNYYDQAAFDPVSLQRRILLGSGTNYLLVHGLEAAVGGQTFGLSAHPPTFQADSISLKQASNQGSATFTIEGSGFTSATTVRLVGGGATRDASGVLFVDSNTLRARVDLSGLSPGDFRVYLSDSGLDTTPPGAAGIMSVENSGSGKLDIKIGAPRFVRVGQAIHATITVANTGTSDISGGTLRIHVTNARPSVAADYWRVVGGGGGPGLATHFSLGVQRITNVPYNPIVTLPGAGDNVDYFFVVPGAANATVDGMLPPGFSETYSFDFTPTFGLGVTSTFTASFVPDESTAPIDWNELQAQLRPSYVSEDAWDAIFPLWTGNLGSTVRSFKTVVNRDIDYFRQLGLNITDVGRATGFELRKADNSLLPGALAQATDAAAPTPGVGLVFDRVALQPISSRYRLGRLGRGWTDNWDVAVSTEPNGDATILYGSRPRFFTRQSDGTYRGSAGDFASLVFQNGAFTLREVHGTITVFQSDGLLDHVQDTNGNRVTAIYVSGRLTSLVHSNGDSFSFVYNAQGRISQLTDQAGRVTTYVYDASGEHLVSSTGPQGMTSYAYETAGTAAQRHALLSVTDPTGTHVYLGYDTRGQLVSRQRDGGVEATTYSYSNPGTITRTDAAGSTQLLVNDMGEIAQATDPLGRVIQFTYNQDGKLVRAAVPGTVSAGFAYDGRGNLTEILDPLGHVTSLSYTPDLNRLARLTDPNGNSMLYGYDSRGNLNGIGHADGTAISSLADSLGNPSHYINRRGHAVGLTHDDRGLLMRQDFSNGRYFAYTYDNRGNLLAAADETGQITTIQYDSGDRPTRVTYPNGRFLHYVYDAGGRRTQMFDQDGIATNYAYDASGRLETLTDGSGGLIVHYTYDATGRLARKDNGNGTSTTQQHDAAGQLLHLVNYSPNGSVNSRFDYAYDGLGRRIGMTTLDGQWTYQYDANGQLLHAVFASTNPAVPNQDLTYVYDANGNRVRTIDNGFTTEYASNNLNEYTSVGGNTLSYDNDGNLVSWNDGSGTTIFNYDDLNRLVTVAGPQGAWTYEYDALGNRIASTHNGQRTEFLIDPLGMASVAARYGPSSGTATHYVNGLGLVKQVNAPGTANYFDYDAIGSTVGLSNSTGEYVNAYRYLPFGKDTASTGTVPNPFLFVGQLGVSSDESELQFMRARFYSAEFGRFLTEDPAGVTGSGTNLLQYAGNSPLNYVDPLGLEYTADEIMNSARSLSSQYQVGLAVAGVGGTNLVANTIASTAVTAPLVLVEGLPFLLGLSYQVLAEIAGPPSFPTSFTGLAISWAAATIGITNYWNLIPPDQISVTVSAGTTQVGSHDPNDMVGPVGYGTSRFVSADATLPYTIRFENDSSADIPAARVVITHQLDQNLDANTFELGNIGFSGEVIQVPAGLTNYNTRLDLTSTFGIYLDVSAGINLTTGLATWILTSVDPATGDLPVDPFTGFLPPNVTPPEGDGFVSYVIRPKTTTATGDVVNSLADIVFDFNPVIPTPLIFNTIDAAPPTSSVAALPAETSAEDFTVTWSGTDDEGGSGVGSYDIYVSIDGGAYAFWIAGTTDTQATYHGQDNHSYAFYSVAIDNVGNREAAPPAADTATNSTLVPPVVTSVVPFVGPTSGGNVVVIAGTGFAGVIAVSFSGQAALSFTVNSSTQITAVAPSQGGNPSLVEVVVTTGSGSSSTAGNGDEYNYAVPGVTSVVINGGDILARNRFGGTPALANQNSVVAQILVTFNMRVNLDADAFDVSSLAGSVSAQGIAPSAVGAAVVATPVSGTGDGTDGYTQYVLTFSAGSGVNSFNNGVSPNVGNSFTTLKDGFFSLNLTGAKVHAGVSNTGADDAEKFWVLYGAVNAGDVKINGALGDTNTDTLLVDGLALNDIYSTFGSSAQTPAGPPIYKVAFDWNIDGNVDGVDLTHLYTNFGTVWKF